MNKVIIQPHVYTNEQTDAYTNINSLASNHRINLMAHNHCYCYCYYMPIGFSPRKKHKS